MSETCIVCDEPATVRGDSFMHRLTYWTCIKHQDQGYEHAMAEHQPCDCGDRHG